ncbi:MAG: flagellar export chaperone FlgN [Ignavibacterium sp.]|nr:flagellar export chaperone FlgN [Ignavibacterium sp.]MCX7610599.1 flagellar export chaperone FlgN [Ignavibacterium sp.]MDW8374153.1 flagellar export chaperone FlgN [Ignavibacteriales bacterium]
MTYEKLIALMQTQKNKLTDLLDTLKSMQKAIIEQEYQDFNRTIELHQRILSDIRNIEKDRTKLIISIIGNQSYSKEKLPQMIFNALKVKDNNLKKKYLDLRDEITNLIKEVTRINFQNMYLIDNSRKLIKDLVVTIYGSANQKILDKKV